MKLELDGAEWRDLWMMKDGGKDLEGRSWRKGTAENSRSELEEAGARI
jgi:hypothetical protein